MIAERARPDPRMSDSDFLQLRGLIIQHIQAGLEGSSQQFSRLVGAIGGLCMSRVFINSFVRTTVKKADYTRSELRYH